MSLWQEWSSGPDVVVWCRGWSTDRETLALALYRLGYVDTGMGAAYQLAESVDMLHLTLPAWVLDDPDMFEAPFAEIESLAGDTTTPSVAVTMIIIGRTT